jgi:hypothetical protein
MRPTGAAQPFMADLAADIAGFDAMNGPPVITEGLTRSAQPFMADLAAHMTGLEAMNGPQGGRGMIGDRWLER